MENTPDLPLDTNAKSRSLTCQGCGANLVYAPGTTTLACNYCGTRNDIIAETDVLIEENDFYEALQQTASTTDTQTLQTVQCNNCGARTTLAPNVVSDECPFCASPLVTDIPEPVEVFRPKSLLPFEINQKKSGELFKGWVKSLWFAPNDLKKRASLAEKLRGIYIPYWTYDSQTYSRYTGQRGDYYYTTETYTDNEGNTRTRQVRHTRWTPVRGDIDHFFDDTLVLASHSLPRKYVDKLEPWDLGSLTGYDERFLSGFQTETYQIDLKNGFEVAKHKMQERIRTLIHHDIGGDVQRIENMHVDYNDITFKHILLPVWISAYRYKDKIYRFLVNGRTGEVQGERPYSAIKIALAVIAALVVLGVLFWLFSGKQRGRRYSFLDSNWDAWTNAVQESVYSSCSSIFEHADLLMSFL